MRLVTFLPKAKGKAETKIGTLLDEYLVLDLRAAAAFYLQQTGREKDPGAFSLERFPGSMAGFLGRGEEALSMAVKAREFAAGWLRDKKALPRNPEGEDLAYSLAGVTLMAPVPRPGKIIAMGLNCYDHAAENKVPPPQMPVGFLKAATSVTGPGADVPYILQVYDASANGLRQHGHSQSYPFTSAEKALGCGRVMIALNANGPRWA